VAKLGHINMTSLDAETSEDTESTDEVAAKPKRKFGMKQIVLFVVAPLVVLAGAGAGVYFSGLLGGGHEEEQVVAAEPVFYELPEFVANLNSTAPMRFVKMKVALEITDKEATKRLDAEMPRVLDTFQGFLRELRPEDVDGSQGMLRVKEELLRRIDLTIRPVIVSDVLVKEIIVQ